MAILDEVGPILPRVFGIVVIFPLDQVLHTAPVLALVEDALNVDCVGHRGVQFDFSKIMELSSFCRQPPPRREERVSRFSSDLLIKIDRAVPVIRSCVKMAVKVS